MDTEQESVCCREFQRCQFLLDEITESEDDTDVCVVDHPSFAPHMDSGVLETYFRIPKVNWMSFCKPTGTFLSGSYKERDWAEVVVSCYLLVSCWLSARNTQLQTASTAGTKKRRVLRRSYSFIVCV
ncbi:hypothetical protein AALO_G00069730 [Alosa alosa]|uniref:Uncharacterized protein n=1 Tax=Alosa alosa TaxID=278164 RepID=A0AAV6H5N3_9TELE|nr:hypothetical protein AALO_G00069730 [Alosa alosa]